MPGCSKNTGSYLKTIAVGLITLTFSLLFYHGMSQAIAGKGAEWVGLIVPSGIAFVYSSLTTIWVADTHYEDRWGNTIDYDGSKSRTSAFGWFIFSLIGVCGIIYGGSACYQNLGVAMRGWAIGGIVASSAFTLVMLIPARIYFRRSQALRNRWKEAHTETQELQTVDRPAETTGHAHNQEVPPLRKLDDDIVDQCTGTKNEEEAHQAIPESTQPRRKYRTWFEMKRNQRAQPTIDQLRLGDIEEEEHHVQAWSSSSDNHIQSPAFEDLCKAVGGVCPNDFTDFEVCNKI